MAEDKDKLIKEAIIDASGVLFQKWGLNKTTMEDIAKAAGKGKSTLYYYYKSKEEIFISFAEREITAIIDRAKKSINDEIKAEDKLKTYFFAINEEFKTSTGLYEILRGEIAGDPLIISHLRTILDTEETGLIYKILDYGMKNNEFRPYPRNRINIISSIIVSTIRSLQVELFLEKKILESDRINLLIEILLHGIKR